MISQAVRSHTKEERAVTLLLAAMSSSTLRQEARGVDGYKVSPLRFYIFRKCTCQTTSAICSQGITGQQVRLTTM
jgi:hypothetical protein